MRRLSTAVQSLKANKFPLSIHDQVPQSVRHYKSEAALIIIQQTEANTLIQREHWGEIKDPVHGYIYITKQEKEIIDSYPVQRLRRLRQLAGSEYVYPGANHTRFEHSIGVMYLASRVIENPNISSHINQDEANMVTVAGLLHDVGHGPFSHVFEHLLDKELGKTHEDLTQWIIEEHTSELQSQLAI